jgi:hypothetical protein
VHDEIVWEIPMDNEHIVDFNAPWAAGLPIAAEKAWGKRYAK